MYKIIVLNNQFLDTEQVNNVWAKHGGELTLVPGINDLITEVAKGRYHLIALIEDYLKDELINALASLSGLTELPIIILTSVPTDRIHDECVLRGAVDYLEMPNNYESGVLRSLAVIKQYSLRNSIQKEIKILGNNGLLILPEYRRVLLNGRILSLTFIEYNILLCLVESNGRVLTYGQLLGNVWGLGYENKSRGSVWNTMNRLKAKLRTAPGSLEYIESAHDIGYRYNPFYAPGVIESMTIDVLSTWQMTATR